MAKTTMVIQFKVGDMIKIGDDVIIQKHKSKNKIIVHAEKELFVERIKSDVSGSGNDQRETQQHRDTDSVSKD